ncbi:MAG: PAS domain-containing protein [Candidatus Schekmanbacteria bacterium]|nr:PAS domain-containing protein [Candidatus Schekmanbacteria bacterium]
MTKIKKTTGKQEKALAKKKDKRSISVPSASEEDIVSLPKLDFPIVGIGASAGGLAAFEAFFSGMPADTDPGMAFVIVQHLSPDHKSILSELVRRYTRMEVFEVEDGMVIKPNCTYIIPPNRDMVLLNGTLHLMEQIMSRGMRLPIDFFFRSLAQELRERSICIVLSGTGSDGTQGVRSIKGEGGMVMVQVPESAEYDGMPQSAIRTGLTDYILPPSEMPARLIAYVSHAFSKKILPVISPASTSEDALKKVCIMLRAKTGHDFSQYKQNTLVRRVERRMALCHIMQLDEYVRYLQQNQVEVESLFRDLLIGVTGFFRDPEAFKFFEEHIIPKIFSGKPAGTVIRVWVPGCSTGEEAYSIAILFQEHLDTLKQTFKVQLFATDIDKRAIDSARSGIFPASITADISPERLSRFFSHEPGSEVYRISKSIRDMLIISEQDVIKDPPFSKLDLISCRNLLIYMSGELQKKLIPMFHYALVPGGMLFLGTSETVGEFADLFATLDRKWKIYQSKEDIKSTHRAMGRFIPPLTEGSRTVPQTEKTVWDKNKISLRELTEKVLLNEYTPSSVVVDEHGDILYIHGRTGRYLEPAPGNAGMNILKMIREGLRRELTIALHKAVSRKELVSCPGLRIKIDSDFTTVNITVRPMMAGPAETAPLGMFMVAFEEAPPVNQTGPEVTDWKSESAGHLSIDRDAQVAALEQELLAKEEYLQTTAEELETSNEELKSSNEEMQSVNEELQSTNEELETSKEELQSVNEELATVNNELQIKVADLSQTNNDMNNLLAGTGVGIIFVDHQLRIRRFTPAVTQVINLIQTDVGRPVGHIVSNLICYDRLLEDTQEVLDTLVSKEVEVQNKSRNWYLLRIRPYRTLENVIEGAVLTFVDITEIVKARESLRRMAVVVKDSHDAVTLQDLDGNILSWNPAAEKIYGWSVSEALTMNVRDRIPERHSAEALARVQQLTENHILEPIQTQMLTKDGRIVEVWLTATALVNQTGKVYAIATTERALIDK